MYVILVLIYLEFFNDKMRSIEYSIEYKREYTTVIMIDNMIRLSMKLILRLKITYVPNTFWLDYKLVEPELENVQSTYRET